ncbi:Hint domain-containing protein [Paracoccus spongiarum]|uniref:Hint domain-containing protein n=1 Tax=Paracoccus spongiarum TaxID=3064387 RepID=A0ABT9JFB4_9RHOB|nr:Hint domain-containing protein [Paracoccus sp. 2205BS29-5]MDP5308511.1 Hint domain-containing protein [Paracoccus sp. 2205BS29-5]
MGYVPTWGVIAPTQVTSNVELAGVTMAPPTYDHSLFIVDDPANGGQSGHLYDNDLLASTGGPDTTTGQLNEGFADTDGGPVIGIAEIGYFGNSTVQLQNGGSITVPIYAFRLEDGRTILRVHDFDLAGFNNAGLARNDIASITLGGAQDYQTLSSVESFRFDLPFAMICFADGTLIDTADGPVAVEDLRPGVLVRTADHGYQPLRLALSRLVDADWQARNDRLRPVRISAGALGDRLPRQDLRVSRQHRMLLSSPICERMFGAREVLVPAIRLTDLPGIYVEDGTASLSYFHLVFDRHEVVFANGAASESFFIGRQALQSLTPEALAELLTLFPDAVERCEIARPARPIPEGGRVRSLVARHVRSGKPMVEPRL